MAARHSSLSFAIEQLARDFAEALVRAIATAPVSEVLATFEAPRAVVIRRDKLKLVPLAVERPAPAAPSARPVEPPRPAKTKAVVAAPPKKKAPARGKPARAPVTRMREVEAHPDVVILDPAALLEMAEQAADALVAADDPPEAAPPPVVPLPVVRRATAPAGEEFLRTTGGSIVLRRKRAVGSVGAP